MFKRIKRGALKQLKKMGWTVVHNAVWDDALYGMPPDYSQAHINTFTKVREYTMTTSQRIVAICNAVGYLEKNNLEGAIVGCGIWRGGVIMAAIDELKRAQSTEREIYLYDTYEGMITPPHEFDVKRGGNSGVGKKAEELYQNTSENDFVYCYASLDDVRKNVNSTGYPSEKIHYVKGLVEDTLPLILPKKIALLYFSIGFYEPVKHALKHLFPLLVPGGVLVISDYEDWEGTKKAVDEYLTNNQIKLLLNRIDNTGRIGVKSNVD